MWSDKFVGYTRIEIFSKASFLIFYYPTHSVFTFCLPRNLLFVYLQHPKYPFCLPSYSIIVLLYYLCIVLKVLFVYLLKTTSYLQPRITCLLFLRPTSTSFCLPSAWRRQRWWRQREARQRGTVRRRQRGGSSTEAAAVAAVQQCNVGGSSTFRECTDTHAFERHRRAEVRVFVVGQGWRDDSVDSIIIVGSDGVARGDVHRGRRCTAAANDDADGDADVIVC